MDAKDTWRSVPRGSSSGKSPRTGDVLPKSELSILKLDLDTCRESTKPLCRLQI